MSSSSPVKAASPMAVSPTLTASSGSSDETLSISFEPNAGAPVAPKTKRPQRTAKKRVGKTPKPKKPKIRTYIRRRTEIEELTDEMKQLKKQMEYYEHRNEVLRKRQELVGCETLNKSLREVLHAQRLSFASTLSMVTQFFRYYSTQPFDLPARLGRDPLERQAALLRMKDDRLQVAHNFMRQREFSQSPPDFSDRKKYEASNGDLVSIRFENIPLPGARSVKAIMNALQTFVYNIEISISDAVGDITIRENDDAKPGSPVAQHRLVATVADLIQTDTNNVTFAEYRPAGPGSGEREMGLMICDAVDEDELFPYQPLTRVQQDMTQITCVAWHRGENGEPIIVMTRWWCLRIRKNPNIYVPPFVTERIRAGVDKVGEAMRLTALRAAAGVSTL